MLGISGTELLIILFFGFLIFGPEKLPQMGKTVGRAIRQFRDASEAANQKFKDEVYDPFKDAVEPYAKDIREQSAPLKEDLDAINQTFKETQDMFKDPFGLQNDETGEGSGAAEKKTPGVKNMVDDMLHDPFDLKKPDAADAATSPDAEGQEHTEPSGEAVPLPSEGVKVAMKRKKTLADSLYGVDGEGGE